MLKMEHPSVRRNVLIADVFYRSGAIEAWGRGIKLMILESQKNNFPDPKIRIYAGGIEMIFSKKEEIIKNVTDNVTDNRLLLILDLIKSNNKISTIEIAKILGVVRRTIARDIDVLKKLYMPQKEQVFHWYFYYF